MSSGIAPRTWLGAALERSGNAVAWAFFVVFAISCFEVVMRYAFNRPTSWVHVGSTALALVAFAAGGAVAMVQGQHMRVSVLIDRAPERWQQAATWLSLTCGVVYLLGLGWGLTVEAWESVWRFDAGHWTPELTPGPPNWPLPALAKLALAMGALLFLLAVLDAALRHWRGELSPVSAAASPADTSSELG